MSLRQQSRRDHEKRRKNLQQIREEEKRNITKIQLKSLLIVENFRKMSQENPNISRMLIHYFSNSAGIENKDSFVNDLLQGNVMVITTLCKEALVQFINDFN